MRLAMYKGPAQDWRHKVAHWSVCWFTGSDYSHCELVIRGTCWSSSARDGGVRGKAIDLTSGRWDVFEIDGDEERALQWFLAHQGQPYDWLGIWRFVLPFLGHRSGMWFCSEACAAALGMPGAADLSPQTLMEVLCP